MPAIAPRVRSLTLVLLSVLIDMALAAPRLPYKDYAFFKPGPGSAQIEALTQDRDGAIWVVASEGVYRWDGSRFAVFPEVKQAGSGWNAVTSGKDGAIWIFASDKTMRFNGATFESVVIAGMGSIESPNAIATGPNGSWYLATRQGIQIAEPGPRGGWTARKPDIPKGALSVSQFVQSDPRNQTIIWFRCKDALCRWDGKQTTEFGTSAGVPAQFWLDLQIQTDGTVWARSPTSVLKLRAGAQKFELVSDSDAQPVGIARVVPLGDGMVGIPNSSGLTTYFANGAKPQKISGLNGIPVTGVVTALKDREGSLWMALAGSGLLRVLGDGAWVQFGESDGLPSERIEVIAAGVGGNLWIGTGGSLLVGSGPSEQKRFRQVPLPYRGVISAIAPTRDGGAWVGLLDGRLLRTNGFATTTTVLNVANRTENDIKGLMVDQQNRLWIMRAGDLVRLSPPFVTVEVIAREKTFHAVQCPSSNYVWVTAGTGESERPSLLQIENATVRRFGEREGLPRGPAIDITCAPGNYVVVTYPYSHELTQVRWEAGRLAVERVDPPSTRPNFAAYDSQKRLWISSERNLSVRSGGRWVHLDKSNGLGADRLVGNFLIDSDVAWAATSHGLVRYQIPSQIAPPRDVQAMVTSVTSPSRKYDPRGLVRFEPGEGEISIEFSGSSIETEDRTSFRYRVPEITANWRETEEHRAQFQQLKQGSYTFEVQARDYYQAWSSQPAAKFRFEVLPFWYETWWFRFSLAALLTGVVLGGVQFRTRLLRARQRELEIAVRERTASLSQEKKKTEALLADSEELKLELRDLSARRDTLLEDERKRISREIHDELGQLLTGLKLRLSFLQQRAGGPDEHLDDLVTQTDTTIQTVRRIASELRPPVLDHFGLAAAIEWQVAEFAKRSGVKANCLVPDDLSVSPQLAITVFRILQEALTNIGRHAHAKNIDVLLTIEGPDLSLQVVDDGRGITSEQKQGRRSLGLLGMSERATAVGGVVEIKRLEEGGTAVEARFPLMAQAEEDRRAERAAL